MSSVVVTYLFYLSVYFSFTQFGTSKQNWVYYLVWTTNKEGKTANVLIYLSDSKN